MLQHHTISSEAENIFIRYDETEFGREAEDMPTVQIAIIGVICFTRSIKLILSFGAEKKGNFDLSFKWH